MNVATRIRKRPAKAKRRTVIVRRDTIIMQAIPMKDVVRSAKAGVEALLDDQSEGTVFVQSDAGPCWRITVELDRSGGVG